MKKKISVVIPTYQRPKLLIKCLHALAEQTFSKANFEIIVAHDGPVASIPSELSMLRERHALNVWFRCTGIKRGPAAARNLGWQHAEADWIAFTDDDCLPHREWLQSFWDAIKGGSTLAYTGKTIVPIPAVPTDYEKNVAHLATASFITANCAIAKKALQAVGGFDERFEKAFREDSDLEFKLKSRGISIHALSSAQVVHPVRTARWGISLFEQKKGIYDALLYKKFPHMYRRYIRKRPLWRYYFIIVLSISLLLIPKQYTSILVVNGVLLSLLFTHFFIKRIEHTKKSSSHMLEMAVTSLLIPFLSIYWKIYGAIKYRVLFF